MLHKPDFGRREHEASPPHLVRWEHEAVATCDHVHTSIRKGREVLQIRYLAVAVGQISCFGGGLLDHVLGHISGEYLRQEQQEREWDGRAGASIHMSKRAMACRLVDSGLP